MVFNTNLTWTSQVTGDPQHHRYFGMRTSMGEPVFSVHQLSKVVRNSLFTYLAIAKELHLTIRQLTGLKTSAATWTLFTYLAIAKELHLTIRQLTGLKTSAATWKTMSTASTIYGLKTMKTSDIEVCWKHRISSLWQRGLA